MPQEALMRTEVAYRPSYSLAIVSLEPGESIRAEGGAMVSMSPTISIQTKAQGGVLKSLARSVLGGESFFINTLTAAGNVGGEVTLAPSLPGDVGVVELNNQTVFVQSGSYLASSGDIDVSTSWGGAKTFFGGEGLILLRVQGSGQLITSSYGAIHEVSLAAGQQYLVDTGHVVTFEETVKFAVRRVGGLKSTLFSGEGLVVEFTGPGRITMQTRSPGAFLAWLIPQLPKKSN
jgi:uncharacterized protein (TIGR00266 family)